MPALTQAQGRRPCFILESREDTERTSWGRTETAWLHWCICICISCICWWWISSSSFRQDSLIPSLVHSDTDLCLKLISARIIVFTFKGTWPTLKPTGDKLECFLIIILIHYTMLIAKATFPPTNTTQGKVSLISPPEAAWIVFFPPVSTILKISTYFGFEFVTWSVKLFNWTDWQKKKLWKDKHFSGRQVRGVPNKLLITTTHILYLAHTHTHTLHFSHVTRQLPFFSALVSQKQSKSFIFFMTPLCAFQIPMATRHWLRSPTWMQTSPVPLRFMRKETHIWSHLWLQLWIAEGHIWKTR